MNKRKRSQRATSYWKWSVLLFVILFGIPALVFLTENYSSSASLMTPVPTSSNAEIEALRLAIEAQQEFERNPYSPLALQLAVAANQQSDSPPIAAQQILEDIASEPGISAVRFGGHSRWITGIAFSPDEQTIVTSARDRTLIVWDAHSGTMIRRLEGHSDSVNSVDYSSDGERILSCSDNEIIVWDATTGEVIHYFPTNDFINLAIFSPDGTQIATGSRGQLDHAVRIRDAETGILLRTMQGHSNYITALAYSPDGTYLVSGSADHTAIVWNVQTSELLHRLEGHEDVIEHVAVSPDGHHVVSSDSNRYGSTYIPGMIIVWDALTGTELFRLEGEQAIYSRDGTEIISVVNNEGILNVWDARTGQFLRSIGNASLESQPYNSLWHPTVSPTGDYIMGITAFGYLTIWNYATGEEINRFPVSYGGGMASRVRFSPAGNKIIGFYRTEIIVWNRWNGAVDYQLEGVNNIAFSPDDRYAAATWQETVVLLDAQTGEQIRQFDGHNSPVVALAFHPQGHQIVSASDDTGVLVWDVETGAIQQQFTGHTAPITDIVYRPDGSQLLTNDGLVAIVRDTATGLELWRFEALDNPKYSPDGQMVAGYTDNAIVILNAQTGAVLLRLQVPAELISRVFAFSPNSLELATAVGGMLGDYQTLESIVVWDLETGRMLFQTGETQWGVSSIVYSPDGRDIASGSVSRRVMVWDAQTGQLLHRLFQTSDELSGYEGPMSVDYSPDGDLLVASTPYAVPWLWNLETVSERRQFPLVETNRGEFVFRPDGSVFVTTGRGSLLIWDTNTGELLRQIEVPEGYASHILYSPNGRSIAYAIEQTITIRDVDTGTIQHVFAGHQSPVTSIAFNGDGTRLVSGSEDGTILLWNVTTGEILHSLEGHTRAVYSVAYSADGTRVASGSDDNTLIVWNTDTGTIVHQINDQYRPILNVVYSPDSSRIAATMGNRIIFLDSVTNEIVQTITFDDYISMLAYSSDGSKIVSVAGMYGYVMVWDAATGEILAGPMCSSSYYARFLPDDTGIACAGLSFSMTIERWQSVEQLLLWVQEHRYLPPLSCDQRRMYQIQTDCTDPSFTFTPTLMPTPTPFPVPEWTPIASPTP